MKKIINLKQNLKTKEFYIDVNDLKDFFNPKKIAFYTLEEKNKTLILTVYDKNQKKIEIKAV